MPKKKTAEGLPPYTPEQLLQTLADCLREAKKTGRTTMADVHTWLLWVETIQERIQARAGEPQP